LAGRTRRATPQAHCTAPADGGPEATGLRPAAREGYARAGVGPSIFARLDAPYPREHRWPSALAVIVAIGLQLVLPNRVVPQAGYLLPVLEGALLVALIVANPFRINRESALLRAAGLALTVLVGLSNGWSAVLLVLHIVNGGPSSPAELLTAGRRDLADQRAGLRVGLLGNSTVAAQSREPLRRTPRPDFLFAQMQSPQLADPDWEPQFLDYLAFTNATHASRGRSAKPIRCTLGPSRRSSCMNASPASNLGQRCTVLSALRRRGAFGMPGGRRAGEEGRRQDRLTSRLIHLHSPESGLRGLLVVTSGTVPPGRSRTSLRGA
jgi:hypothetical protein